MRSGGFFDYDAKRERLEEVERELGSAEVWNDPDLKTSKTLDMHMSWLRRKIGGERRIATVRGVGFRFNTDPD